MVPKPGAMLALQWGNTRGESVIQQVSRYRTGPVHGRIATRALAQAILSVGLFALAGTTIALDAPRTRAEFEQYKKTQNDASNAAYQAGELDRCRAIETEVLEMSRRFGDRREEAGSIYALGLVDTATGRPDEAEARFRESIVLWKAINDQKGLALSLRGLGRVLEAKGRLPEATEVQVAALELLLKFGKPMDQSESYYSLARLFMNLEDYPAARRAVDRAIVLMGPSPPDFPLGLNLAVQADVLRELGQAEAARDSAQRGLDAFTRTKSPMGEAIGQLALGKALAVTGEADRGLAMLRTAEATAQKMQEEVLATDLRVAQGLVLVQEKRYEQALVPLAKALETAERLHLDQILRNVSIEQEKAYSALGRPSDALAASKRAYAAQSRLAGLAKVGELAGRSAESQLSAISGRFMSLDAATRASAPVLAPKPAPLRAAPVSPWLWALAAVAVLGLFALGLRILRLREESRRMGRAHAELKDHSAQLAHQVSIDPLTGVMTRRAFTEELAALLQVAKEGAMPLTLAVFDLDHFKQVNDQHGHLTGDAALRLLVGLVREQLDSEDLFGRFGGDEFLLASRADLATMQALAERIRAAVELRSRAPDSGLPPLSISLGLAQAGPDGGYEAEDLFQRADTALYAAKAGGRNRVVIAEPPKKD
jgi:diguanylate cyclase (GGDEF)-like protein